MGFPAWAAAYETVAASTIRPDARSRRKRIALNAVSADVFGFCANGLAAISTHNAPNAPRARMV